MEFPKRNSSLLTCFAPVNFLGIASSGHDAAKQTHNRFHNARLLILHSPKRGVLTHRMKILCPALRPYKKTLNCGTHNQRHRY